MEFFAGRGHELEAGKLSNAWMKEWRASRAEATCKVEKQRHQKCIKAFWATAGKHSVSRKGQRQEGTPSGCRPLFSPARGLNQSHDSFSTWSVWGGPRSSSSSASGAESLEFFGGRRSEERRVLWAAWIWALPLWQTTRSVFAGFPPSGPTLPLYLLPAEIAHREASVWAAQEVARQTEASSGH